MRWPPRKKERVFVHFQLSNQLRLSIRLAALTTFLDHADAVRREHSEHADAQERGAFGDLTVFCGLASRVLHAMEEGVQVGPSSLTVLHRHSRPLSSLLSSAIYSCAQAMLLGVATMVVAIL